MALQSCSKWGIFSSSRGSPALKVCHPSIDFYTGLKGNNCISILAKSLMLDFLYYCSISLFSKKQKTTFGSHNLLGV